MELKNIFGLKQEEIDLLSRNWITTAEEFVSISTNKNLSIYLQNLLKINKSRYNEVNKLICNSIPDSKIKEINKFKNIQNKTGAKKPKK